MLGETSICVWREVTMSQPSTKTAAFSMNMWSLNQKFSANDIFIALVAGENLETFYVQSFKSSKIHIWEALMWVQL